MRELVAAQFPNWADLPVQRVEHDGHDNRTFRLGTDMAVRLPSHPRYAAQVRKEQEWLPQLAPLLPLEIPIPIAVGRPTARYQLPWSVYRWLEGEDAAHARVRDPTGFAMSLAEFLNALQAVDLDAGPMPGEHNFFRGGPLTIYDDETRRAIATLRGHIDVDAVTAVWDEALRSTWETDPVWIHGDVAASNLLVRGGSLAAVIDFGCSGVGDPACDLAIAWTFFAEESRTSFRNELQLDESTWARARGWAIWKGLITLVDTAGADTPEAVRAQRLIEVVIVDHRMTGNPDG